MDKKSIMKLLSGSRWLCQKGILLVTVPVIVWMTLNQLKIKVSERDQHMRIISPEVPAIPISHPVLKPVSIRYHKKQDDHYYNYRERARENCQQDDDECLRFRSLLSNWPEHKPRAAIYIITRESSIKEELIPLLEGLDLHFNKQYKYPIIIFLETLSKLHADLIRNSSSSDIYLQKVKFEIPEFVRKPIPSRRSKETCSSSVGYRHMIRFQAKLIYEQPIMKGLDYYWRLDSDSYITRKINYDVFSFMNMHQYDYGYCWIQLDSKTCTLGLWDHVQKFIQQNNIKTQFFHEWPDQTIYYNNFEISAMSIWMSRDYANYIDYIDKKGGIYYHRWGDAPIKGIAVAMFVPKKKTYRFADIGYTHNTYVN